MYLSAIECLDDKYIKKWAQSDAWEAHKCRGRGELFLINIKHTQTFVLMHCPYNTYMGPTYSKMGPIRCVEGAQYALQPSS